VEGRPVLDLSYAEDSTADVDMNVVLTGRGGFVELQGTAEREPFQSAQLTRMLQLARQGARRLLALQRQALGSASLRGL
jgi:ribonuclease PH